ncbi:hypothetical protein SEA_LEMOND_85 [Mycobacterium phage LeMond]|uniref:Uncharacterized protein n=1 Tax=Mycobacterium phage KiSi TaxID=2507856 RepID=A0A410TC68_9CAUD|nr:hypothetical protein I5G98_gp022 [Mycobacterium phage KiSi]AYR01150.1 hypothetical protein SEA_LEMOND_85 [Mycobacterium phage LeMond]AYR01253.1 hypothetical protein SEA_OSCAR_86 [Mycobacterium phage Oscar]AYR01685.1 hypothetical protein SEA_SCARLETT_85 [Mycobacterium phage Scarlett]QAU06504.1 hypothetical protein SEA_KISI_86 [Mycobacterium phage KiSi]
MFDVSEFVMARSAAAEPFHCARCDQDKKAKAKATRTTAEGTAVLCNGCYGMLKSLT